MLSNGKNIVQEIIISFLVADNLFRWIAGERIVNLLQHLSFHFLVIDFIS